MQHLLLPLCELWPSDVQTQALSLYFQGPYSKGAVVQRRNAKKDIYGLIILKLDDEKW